MSQDTPEVVLEYTRETKTRVKLQFGIIAEPRILALRFPEGSSLQMRDKARKTARHLQYVRSGSVKFDQDNEYLLTMKLRRGDIATMHKVVYHICIAIDRHNRDERNANNGKSTASHHASKQQTCRRPSRHTLGSQTA